MPFAVKREAFGEMYMTHVSRMTGSFVALLCIFFPVVAGHSESKVDNIEDALRAAVLISPHQVVEISPMTQQGEQSPGTYTKVAADQGIFQAIFSRVGIVPGVTLPKDLEAKEGFIE